GEPAVETAVERVGRLDEEGVDLVAVVVHQGARPGDALLEQLPDLRDDLLDAVLDLELLELGLDGLGERLLVGHDTSGTSGIPLFSTGRPHPTWRDVRPRRAPSVPGRWAALMGRDRRR